MTAPAPALRAVARAGAAGGARLLGRPYGAATTVSTLALLVLLAARLVAPETLAHCAPAVLVIGLLLGLPHGAVDHLVPALVLRDRAPSPVAVGVLYAAVAVGAWLLLREAPAAGLTAFVAVSVVHFGTGEVTFADRRAGRPLHPDPVAVLATGGSALLLPLVGAPTAVAPILTLLVPGSSGRLPSWLTTGVLVVVLAGVGATCLRLLCRGRVLQTAEVTLLACVGLLVPPLAAFGTYFGAWHGVRHIASLLAQDPTNTADLTAGGLARPLRRFAATAALPTALALAALLALWAAADGVARLRHRRPGPTRRADRPPRPRRRLVGPA